jgi:hypothetical protein
MTELFFSGMSAATAAGIAVAAGAILTGLYLLKLQRRRVLVPFAPLWAPLGGEKRSERLARRLRRWLSLLLQLMFAALILLAAADPRPAAANRAGRTLLILVDRSASMSAKDGDRGGGDDGGGRGGGGGDARADSRLAQARRIARGLATGLGAADRAMVASFASGVSAESAFDTDPIRLGATVAGIRPSQEPADLGRALDFAAAVLRGKPHPTLIVVSDGAYSSDERTRVRWNAADGPRSLAGIDARFAPVGRRGDNVAILSFAARRYPADPTSVEAAIAVQSFRDRPCDVTLEITAGAERLPVDRVRLHLGPREQTRHVLPDVAAPDTLLEARVTATPADDLAVDDTAFAVVPGLARWKVLRVGEPDLFLDGALLSLGAGVEVRRAPAKALEAGRATWARYDAVIFDGVTPSPPPTAGGYIYLDPRGPASPFADRGAVLRDPIITDTHKAHPLLRFLALGDVNIAEARRLALSPGDEAVASALGAPLILTRTRPGLRIAALAFDIRRSDLPMRTAFPLLLSNALAWVGAPETIDAASLRTGRTFRVALPAERTSAAVIDPAGATHVLPAQAGAVNVPIAHTGFYRVNGSTVLAANLGDAVESDTTPARALVLGGRTLAPPDPPARGARRELWALALIAGVALSLFEWWSYHRRWTV